MAIELLTSNELAALLGVTRMTVHRMVADGRLPKGKLVRGAQVWSASDIPQLQSQETQMTTPHNQPGHPDYERRRKALLAQDEKVAQAKANKDFAARVKALDAENDRRLRAGLPLVELQRRVEERNLIPVAQARPSAVDDFRDRQAFDSALAAGDFFTTTVNGKQMVDADEVALSKLAATQSRTADLGPIL